MPLPQEPRNPKTKHSKSNKLLFLPSLYITSKHTYLAQNVRPLDIYRWGWGGSPAYPLRKEDINEEDSLTGANLMHYIWRTVDG